MKDNEHTPAAANVGDRGDDTLRAEELAERYAESLVAEVRPENLGIRAVAGAAFQAGYEAALAVAVPVPDEESRDKMRRRIASVLHGWDHETSVSKPPDWTPTPSEGECPYAAPASCPGSERRLRVADAILSLSALPL